MARLYRELFPAIRGKPVFDVAVEVAGQRPALPRVQGAALPPPILATVIIPVHTSLPI